MRKRGRFMTAMVVVALATATVAGNAAPGGAAPVGAAGPGDGLGAAGGQAAAPAAGSDSHEKAAADNNAVERAAKDKTIAGKPIVPQRPGVPTPGGTEAANQGGGLAATTAPAAAPVGPTAPAPFKRPVAGTSATVRFTDAAPASAASMSPHLRGIVGKAKRVRTVNVDTGSLGASLAAAKVSLDLFADVTVPLDTAVAPSKGAGVKGMSSTTYSAGGKSGAAVVTIIGGDVHAAIWKGTTKYGIKPLGNGRHIVFEDGRVFPGEDEPSNFHQIQGDPPGAKRPAAAPSGGAGRIASAFPVIDVMVAFDDAAQTQYGSVDAAQADIIEMINLSNMAYANSLNDQQLALTNIVDLNYTPNAADGTTNDNTYLSAIRSTADGIVDNLHTLRDANSADLVSVISNISACGIAYLPASANPADLDAYSIVDFDCGVGNLSFPHELGHNMCAHHDPPNAGANPCAADGFGHFGIAENLRTIMSYANATNGCSTCVRIPYFSNPNVTYSGWTTGILGSRDNSRVLEQTDLDVSNYRAPISSPAVAGVDGNSCIFNTVDDAISMAPAGSTIYIAPGTYPAVTANVDYNISKNLDLVRGTADCEPTAGGASTDVVLQPNAGSTIDAVVEVYGSAVVRLDRITIEGGNSAEGTLYVSGTAQVTLDGSIVRNGTNPSVTVGGGGVRVSGAAAQLTSINDSQIENNTAQLGGGVFVDDGTVTINGLDNVELNTANVNGGGIHATNNATVVLSNNADVLNNAATSRGGGVYLNGASTLSVTGAATFVGIAGQDNTATLGAGVFAEGGATVTVGGSGAVSGNSGGFGAGIYGLGAGTTVRVNQDGTVSGNTATSNGGGILVTLSALADLNAGADVTGNSATGWGGGIAVFSPATLDADGSNVAPVLVSGNSAGTVGGGIWSSGASALDTVHIVSNTATAEGGGLYIPSTGAVTVTENSACGPASLTKEHYCNEFRSNTAGTTGGAVYATGGDFTAVQIAFVGNHANNAAVIMAFGDSVINVRAALVISNTETVAADEALITGHNTSSITLVGVTSANQTEWFLDTDDTATATVSRVLTTTGTLGLVAMPAGSCNISAVAATLPDLLVTPVLFTSTARTDFMPVAGAPGLDRCLILGGHSTDIDDTAVIDVAPAGANDYDVGGFEATA